jgi:hypothetical protein
MLNRQTIQKEKKRFCFREQQAIKKKREKKIITTEKKVSVYVCSNFIHINSTRNE